MNTNWIIVTVLVVLVILFIVCHATMKKAIVTKEPYSDVFFAKDYAKGHWQSVPSFKADLSPRFDSTRVGGGYIVGDFPGMDVQGAPLTPVAGLKNYTSAPNYASIAGGAYADERLPAGGLTTTQVNSVLSDRFSENNKINETLMQKYGRSGTENYTHPKELLPVPDMKKAISRDPSDPNLFMYDRYLFSNLKRRYPQVNVDFIRGDLNIQPIYTGWFDSRPTYSYDLQQGYFADYMDIQQSTALKDLIYERGPTQVEKNIPWGQLARETAWSVL